MDDCRSLVFEKTHGKCTISSIDEGIYSYKDIALQGKVKIDNVYLYKPNLALYISNFNNIEPIPQISVDDKKIINILNYVFDFHKEDLLDLSLKIIFFDQPWQPMPRYLQNDTWKRKTIFANAYKKHLKESVWYDHKMHLFKKLVEICPKGSVYVKMHPRSDKKFIEDYKKYGCKLLPHINAPWELFCLNSKISNGIWVTVNSGALCSYGFIMNTNLHNKYVFGYRAATDKTNDEFLEKYSNYEESVFIPNNMNEYVEIINALNNEI